MISDREGQRPRQRKPDASGERDEPRKVVLLIEDNPLDRDIYGSLLWYNGYDVIHAEDGETGLARAIAERPELILLDLGLPRKMEGLDVLRKIRAEGLDIPVVALTATGRDELGEAAHEFHAYLEKPVAPVEVVRAVQRLIDAPAK